MGASQCRIVNDTDVEIIVETFNCADHVHWWPYDTYAVPPKTYMWVYASSDYRGLKIKDKSAPKDAYLTVTHMSTLTVSGLREGEARDGTSIIRTEYESVNILMDLIDATWSFDKKSKHFSPFPLLWFTEIPISMKDEHNEDALVKLFFIKDKEGYEHTGVVLLLNDNLHGIRIDHGYGASQVEHAKALTSPILRPDITSPTTIDKLVGLSFPESASSEDKYTYRNTGHMGCCPVSAGLSELEPYNEIEFVTYMEPSDWAALRRVLEGTKNFHMLGNNCRDFCDRVWKELDYPERSHPLRGSAHELVRRAESKDLFRLKEFHKPV
eukprot:PhF_6_TR31175/c0_g1_i2/m.45702